MKLWLITCDDYATWIESFTCWRKWINFFMLAWWPGARKTSFLNGPSLFSFNSIIWEEPMLLASAHYILYWYWPAGARAGRCRGGRPGPDSPRTWPSPAWRGTGLSGPPGPRRRRSSPEHTGLSLAVIGNIGLWLAPTHRAHVADPVVDVTHQRAPPAHVELRLQVLIGSRHPSLLPSE